MGGAESTPVVQKTTRTLNVSQDISSPRKIYLNYTFIPRGCTRPVFTWVSDGWTGYHGKVETSSGDTTYTHTFAKPVPPYIKDQLTVESCEIVDSHQPGKFAIRVEITRPDASYSLEGCVSPSTVGLNVALEQPKRTKIILTYTFVPEGCSQPVFTFIGDHQTGYCGRVATRKGDTTYTHTFAKPVPPYIKDQLTVKGCKIVSSYREGNCAIRVKIEVPDPSFSLSPYLTKPPPK